ncbi:putative porin [Achromobacter piechaudii]|uniref:Bacterial type II secretion system chaperone protein (Type_III_yscG) n=1 Tax=Achromobacter piechaudii ATCC 43553 TaxID=742159 RepID=D4XGS4_9BURK|nr:putative porin [Achromobacter piechaudii]EFF74020.1 bacterial type II secretion system chaperone protein (type_III_yscG) [Achromobacter piechaudii ATCC 43553]
MKFPLNRLAASLALVLVGAASLPAHAAPAPSENATINLIRLLVQQGVLKPEQANALVAQAEAEASAARQATPDRGASVAQAGDVRVPYIPQTVRDQIRDEVKAEVMVQAKEENWAQPNTFPDWVSRITVEGDVRVRDESRLYNGGNSNEITDFAKLNAKGPYDVNPNTNGGYPPMLNTREDRRNQLRIRARLGVRAEMSEAWSAGIRLATGSDDSPVSTSQTLGGGMGKKDIWLDQAYLTYRPAKWATVTGGRIANPFESTDTLFSNDLNFDGIAAIFKQPLQGRDVTLFGTLGAFATEYANNGWNSSSMNEGATENKWLLGAQVGADWKINPQNSLRGALAYYHFDNIAGQRSSSCSPWAGAENCDTDWSRPAFMQKGNTLFLLRNIAPNPLNPADTPQPQYVGLASKFDLLDLNLRWDTRVFDGLGLRLNGNYIRNLAYSKNKMASRSQGYIVNNFGDNGDIESGPNAWMLQATLGRSYDLKEKGDWLAFVGYKYIQPDALPDAFNDSSFHQGGTNARGYYIGAGYAFEKNVYGVFRWMSTKEIYGPPLAIDTMQFEINARF